MLMPRGQELESLHLIRVPFGQVLRMVLDGMVTSCMYWTVITIRPDP